jgi:anti-anti-sigma factor
MFEVESRARPDHEAGPGGDRAGWPPFRVFRTGPEPPAWPGQLPRALLRVSGEVDLLTAPRLADALDGALAGGALEVVVDLAEVEFIDVTGIRVLARGAGQASRAGGRLVLQSPSRQARRMLSLLYPEALDPDTLDPAARLAGGRPAWPPDGTRPGASA